MLKRFSLPHVYWLVVWNIFYFWESSSQLTNSYFSRWWLNHQPDKGKKPIENHSTRKPVCHWIGLRENLQESPIFNGKNYGFL
jgi:hypothetical protein